MVKQRTIAIGDIHGHLEALNSLIDLIASNAQDTLVLLGDYIDRGPHSAQVVQRIIDLSKRFKLIALKGNHEEMLLKAFQQDWYFNTWMANGGEETLDSYGGELAGIPESHLIFFENLPLVYQIENHFFAHAGFTPNRELNDQLESDALWGSLDNVVYRHFSGKIAIVGHTPQMNRKVLDRDFIKCIDTGCGFGGVLTAYDVQTGEWWQADEQGVAQSH